MRRITKISMWALTGLAILIAGASVVNSDLKASVDTESLSQSSRFHEGKFLNEHEFEQPGFVKTLHIFKRFFTEAAPDKFPVHSLPVQAVTRTQLDALTNDDIHLIKLGHSSVLMKVLGEYWLFDPVFSERASPFSFLGPKRFHQTPISIDELPPIARVLISHNHYDHLDKTSVQKLASKTGEFFVPLGVDKDLQRWGIDAAVITTFDWWQEWQTEETLVAFTPTQHFSGRGLGDSNNTLWGSWVVKTPAGAVYFSGDSGYFTGFKDIGNKYGPFDITFIETGAYDADWPSVHMTPEESVTAHQDLQGKMMIPIHNGTFSLAFHTWYDPLERVSSAALQSDVTLLAPQFGQPLSLSGLAEQVAAMPVNNSSWWRELMPAAVLAKNLAATAEPQTTAQP